RVRHLPRWVGPGGAGSACTGWVEDEVPSVRRSIDLANRREHELLERQHNPPADRNHTPLTALPTSHDDPTLDHVDVLHTETGDPRGPDTSVEKDHHAEPIADLRLRGYEPCLLLGREHVQNSLGLALRIPDPRHRVTVDPVLVVKPPPEVLH